MATDTVQSVGSATGRLLRRLGLTFTSAAVLAGFWSLYAMILRPVVETPGLRPQIVANESVWAPARPRMGEEMANRYLASQPWAAKAKYILRTDEAYIYFEEWDPLEDDKAIRFAPFAMVWMKKDNKPDEEPVTIISDSAYVRFAHKFKITSPNAGRVINGALEGSVLIEGDKGMRVVGRNFVFSEKHMRIWCDNHVDFAYGPHKGNGHGLQVELIPDEVKRAQEKLAVKGFKTVRLRRNVSMDLEFREGEANPLASQENRDDVQPANEQVVADANSNQAVEAAPPKEPTIVKVRSAGSFEFEVATNVATFEDEVRVYQPTEPGKYNSLQSDVMTLYFEPKKKPEVLEIAKEPGVQPVAFQSEQQPAQPADDSSFQDIDANLTFQRLVATGDNVILRSETNDLIAMMQSVDHSATSRLTKMSSSKTVRVLQKQSEMHSPEIDLLHEEGGKVSHLWARGAGWLKNLDEKTKKLAFAAQWKKELRKLPDPRTGLDVIELETEALVRQPEDQFGLAADFIRLWLKPEAKTAPPKATAMQPTKKTAAEKESGSRMQPERLLALNNVAIVSPEMQGQAKRLEVWFEPAPPKPGDMEMDGADDKESRNGLTPAIKIVPNQPEASQEKVDAPPPSSPEETEGEKKTEKEQPIEVVSDLIRVKVLTHAKERKSEVSEVWTEGQVQVRQKHGPDELPLHMTGNRLHVLNKSRDDQVMTLWGSPAHVRDRGTHIEGKEIFLDRIKNESRVNGEGLLQLPVKKSLDGEELAESKLLDIWWSDEMTFDGLNANFFGDVRAVLNNDGLRSNMRCEEMQVVLSKQISFTESQKDREKSGTNAEVSRVFCKDGVEFDSYKYQDSEVIEVRRGRFAEFAINQTTGDTKGQGPGWIKVWRRGQSSKNSLTPGASVKANRSRKPDDPGWEYLRIDFAGTADGNLKQKFNTFKDRVQILYGPVERSLMVIELENLPKDAGWMRCENLRMTQNESKTAPKKTYLDLLATGNAELEGRSFNARADSISFDESKGLYTLRSQGRRKATIWRQTQVGGQLSRADAQLMHFIPARNILKLDQAIGLDGVN